MKRRRHHEAWLVLGLLTETLLCSQAAELPLSVMPLAFAGGGFGAKPKPTKRKKKRPLGDISAPPKIPEPKVELDKWGLPPPTLEDIFPPMPAGTELIAAQKSHYTLAEIKEAMKDHIPLNLDRFDENAVEKNPLAGREPMRLRLMHQSPPVLAMDHFFTPKECQEVQEVAMPPTPSEESQAVQVESATFSPLAQSKRTSTSWFCHYFQVPTLLAKAHHMLGIPLEQMEEPQIVQYKTGQEFSWHYDEVPKAQLDNGGQRLATLLVYLNTVDSESGGGSTVFRDLTSGKSDNDNNMLAMKPVQGSALLFFPAYADGRPDDRTLHKGEMAKDEKCIVQMWIHERSYRAVVPPGNSQREAQEAVDQVSQQLGYISKHDE